MSGVSFTGGVSRCFPDWQRVIECTTNKNTDDLSKCIPLKEDYIECLHHRKEASRNMRIAEELARRDAAGDSAPPVEKRRYNVADLGLVKEDN